MGMHPCYACQKLIDTALIHHTYEMLCRDCAKSNYAALKDAHPMDEWYNEHPVWDSYCDQICRWNSVDQRGEGGWGVQKTIIKNMNFGKKKVSETLTPPELESLRFIADGKAWKVEYSRLERLTELGYINALGSALTKSGKEIVERNKT